MIRVVLADDHPTIREWVARMLSKQANITVVGEAENGWEALDLVERIHPDGLILDIEMPRLGGIDVVRILRQADSPTRVVVLSNYNDAQIVSELLDLGVDGFVAKEDAYAWLVPVVQGIDGSPGQWVSPSIRG